MIEKFNFYDVYGYLIPGGTLLALLWLPYARTVSEWPKIFSWAGAMAAAAVVVAAYITGHLVQTIANQALPSTVKGKGDSGKKASRRQPSSVLLDSKDSAFVCRLEEMVRTLFGISVFGDDRERATDVDTRRGEAFLLCRAALVDAKVATYVEQFEGMYTLMRGLSLVFLFGAGYLSGWALSQFASSSSQAVAGVTALFFTGVGTGVSIAAAPLDGRCVPSPRRSRLDRWACASVIAALIAFGCYLGASASASFGRSMFLPVAFVAVFCSFRCYVAYRSFTWSYAGEVWRGFVAYQMALRGPAPAGSGGAAAPGPVGGSTTSGGSPASTAPPTTAM